MILVSLLGMKLAAAFPIMMGSCAFLMPVASVRFVRTRTYDPKAATSLALGGLPAALLASLVFLKLSEHIGAVRWLVICVVVYTSLNMLLTAGQAPEGQEGLEGQEGREGRTASTVTHA
jgi:uncharacterized membrane protein YfcA